MFKKPIEGYFAFILFAVMTIVMFIEVVSRYIFDASLTWTNELTRFMFIWFIFITASYALAEKSHIRVESISNLIPYRFRYIADVIGKAIWLLFSLYVTYLGINYSLSMWGSLSPALSLPVGLVYLGIPLGFGLMSLRIVSQITGTLKTKSTTKQPTDDGGVE